MKNWFYLIDKPLWISSFDVIRELRKKLNIKKIWHTWTLDPLASWGLILAVWNYTKLISYLEKDRKTYEFIVNLNWVTDSFDLAEKIKFLDENLQEKYKKELSIEKIKEVLNINFSWKVSQIPPKYSALKINWKRAYDLARSWNEVSLNSREIEIFNIEILDFSYPKLELKAEVSAWTYIRSIASDLWEILWTGWYITKLRRTKIGNLDLTKSQKLNEFEGNKQINIKELFINNYFIELDNKLLEKINHGLKVKWDFNFKVWNDLFVINNVEVTNIIEYDWEYLIPRRKI